MTRLNGSLKWILGSIAIGGFVITVGTLFFRASWQASALSKTVEQNCGEDQRVHPIAENSEKAIIGIEKDIGQTQKDIGQIMKGQETMNKKLDDLFILQMTGPGSGPIR